MEADVYLADGSMGRAAVPSGASTGEHEAVELRDGDKSRYLGKGTLKAVGHINGEIATALDGHGRRASRPSSTSTMIELDGTPNKGTPGRQRHSGRFHGRRARRGRLRSARRSTATWAASARSTLPVPMMNIINGGAHADNSVDVQEFMIAPFGAPKFSEALRMGAEVFHTLKKVLKKRGYSTAVGDEGGFAPNLKSNEEAIEVGARSHHAGRLQARRADRHLPRPGRQRVLRATASTSSRNPTRASAPPSRWWNSGPTGCASIRPSSPSKTAWPKRIGTAGS